MNIHILAVDDEQKVRDMVCQSLEQEGFQVTPAKDGMHALSLLQQGTYSLVLLDWMMPGMNGLAVFHAIRQVSDIPVIFLTAKSDEIDKVLGLELGADDYITKPFSLRELAARIRVVLRRWQKTEPSPAPLAQEHLLMRGDLHLNTEKYTVSLRNQEISLTPTEYKLLLLLAESPGRVYTRLQLLELALGEEYSGYERSVDTHIRNLRKKIEPDPSAPSYILTVFGIGYKFGEQL